MALGEGSVIAGTYALDQVIGRGGQGVLWAATDRRTRERVAVKVFGVGRAHIVDWSRREITVLRALPPSPFVVTVRDFGNVQGEVYLVMDWIDGRPLHELSRPRLERLQHWSRQICLGLDHCHRNRVYHRDVKPSNVMITSASDAVLVDFGIARTDDSTLTFPGYPVGSAPYMSPERWTGDRGDRRSDLYSFGCLLYELLTGDPPFGRMREPADVELLRYKHLNDRPVPPRAGFSGIPESIDRLTMALLNKNPDDRPSSAREVADRLEEIVHPGTTPVDGPGQTPYINPDSLGILHQVEAALQDALKKCGPDHLETLEARAEVAKQTGLNGDRAGAIRAYDKLIPDYIRVFGPYDRRTQDVREARMIWVLGKVP
jgi:eukaryotic-like serine/threonine-protein kinase